jgi:glycogen debranching enzyme
MSQPWASAASASLGGGRGIVTLVEGSAFAISSISGDMEPGFPHGLFFRDTRYLSELCLRLNDARPETLAASNVEPFSAAFVVRDQPHPGAADSGLVLFRTRYVGNGMRENLEVRNFGVEPAQCSLQLLVNTDFADLFEVKAGRIGPMTGDRAVEVRERRITWRYRRGSFSRAVHLDVSDPAQLSSTSVVYDVVVPRGGTWSTCVQITPVMDDHDVAPMHPCGQPVERSAPSTRLEAWRRRLPMIDAEHAGFSTLVARSTEDLAALRLFDPDVPERAVVAAGAPWFMTLFGRDSLLTSWMALMIDADLALGTLQTLARYQGTTVDPRTEEEPGRILHEIRLGESAEASLGGSSIYYGTVDATPLFVMMLGELRRWGHEPEAVNALLPAADLALAWIEQFGDRDGDGYVEYERTGAHGLANQGWKDSHDSTRYADGRLATPPIALCEVQAYTYAALLARAECAEASDDTERASRLRDRAADLKARFNRDFWLDDRGWLAMGLDGDKRPLDALTSNMGHCLWTGIVDDDKAARIGELLVSPAMFSGWGIRTLADSMGGFNPISYHNGSVWPHDTAICVAGLVRYGLLDAAQRVAEGLVAAAAAFGGRLPELFAGLPRSMFPVPVSYPTSCSPQAWAAASPLLLLRALLRLEPDARSRRLHLAPALPAWLGRLRLDGLTVLGGELALEAEGDECQVLAAPLGITVVSEPVPSTA